MFRQVCKEADMTKITSVLLKTIGLALLFSLMTAALTFGAAVLPANVSVPSSGCVLRGIQVTYLAQQQAGLNRINDIRKEACDNGVPDPRTGKPLSPSDFKPMQWSAGLEQIARLRAAECSVSFSHERPNGTMCFDLNGWTSQESTGECIAASGGSYASAADANIVDLIDLWYSEKSTYVNGGYGVTGHYTSMIDPSNVCVGLGFVFAPDSDMEYNLAGEFSREASENTAFLPGYANVVQTVEISQGMTGLWQIKAAGNNFKVGASVPLALVQTLNSTGAPSLYGLAPVSWTSSDPSVAAIGPDGVLQMYRPGTVTVTALSADGSASISIVVRPNIVTKKMPALRTPSVSKRKVTVAFSKLSKSAMKKAKVTGIEIQVAKDKKFTLIYKDKILKKTASKYSFKGKKKTTYYIRMRYVCKSGVGKWTKVKKIKTKK